MAETAFILREEEAMKAYVSGMTVSDGSAPSSGRPIPVWFRNPEPEMRDRTFPYITIDLIDVSESQERGRHNNGRIKVNDLVYTPPGQILTQQVDHTNVASMPMPVNLDFQVSSHARSGRHDRQMWSLLLRKFPGRWGALAIPGDGTARSMFLLGSVGDDGMDDGKRIFRRIFTVRVLSELWASDIRNIANLQQITFTFTLPLDASIRISELDCHAE